MCDSSYTYTCVGLYSTSRLYFSPGRIVPVPASVATEISFGRRANENCCGSKLWFSMQTVALAALWLKTVPKSIYGGVKVTALTEKQHKMLNLTGKTWLAPVTLIGILIVKSSNSSLGGSSSFCFTRYLLHVVRMERFGLNLSQISKWLEPWIYPRVGLNSRYGLKSLGKKSYIFIEFCDLLCKMILCL